VHGTRDQIIFDLTGVLLKNAKTGESHRIGRRLGNLYYLTSSYDSHAAQSLCLPTVPNDHLVDYEAESDSDTLGDFTLPIGSSQPMNDSLISTGEIPERAMELELTPEDLALLAFISSNGEASSVVTGRQGDEHMSDAADGAFAGVTPVSDNPHAKGQHKHVSFDLSKPIDEALISRTLSEAYGLSKAEYEFVEWLRLLHRQLGHVKLTNVILMMLLRGTPHKIHLLDSPRIRAYLSRSILEACPTCARQKMARHPIYHSLDPEM